MNVFHYGFVPTMQTIPPPRGHPIPTSRRSSTRATAFAVASLLIVLVLPSTVAVLTLGAPVSLPATSPPQAHALSAPSTVGSRALAAAVASLGTGAGPAAGLPESCAALVSTSSSLSCSPSAATAAPSASSYRSFSSLHGKPISGRSPPAGAAAATGPSTLPAPGAGAPGPLSAPGPASFPMSPTQAPGCGVPLRSGSSAACAAPVARSSTPARTSSAGPNFSPNFAYAEVNEPAPRQYPMMTYDPVDGYVLLFGGSNDTGRYFGDTWTYSGGAWTELHPTISPTARDDGVLVWDAADGYALLFGGYNPDVGVLNDTWTFVNGAWTQVETAHAPPAEAAEGGAYDASASQVVIFGGYQPSCGYSCSDTWTYRSGAWTKVATPTSPSLGIDPTMFYDPLTQYVVAYGGYGSLCSSTQSYYCESTWKYVGGDWYQLPVAGALCGAIGQPSCPTTRSPSAASGMGSAWDATDGYGVIWGGANNSAASLSTWSFQNGNWTNLNTTVTPDAYFGNWNLGMTWDGAPADGYVFAWGGQNLGWDTHENFGFVGGTWKVVSLVVTPYTLSYEDGDLVYDAADGYVLDDVGGQTWKFLGGSWTELFPATEPPATEVGGLTFDPTLGKVVHFGGYGLQSGQPQNQVWYYAGGDWSLCTTCGTAPSPRQGEVFVYDPQFGGEIMFGGQGSSPAFKDGTWLLQGGTTWVNLTSTLGTPPSARAGTGYAYDPAIPGLLVFGGQTFGSVSLGDTWILQPSGWSQPVACGGPSQPACTSGPVAGYASAMFYDPPSAGVYLIGLDHSGSFYGTSFEYVNGGWAGCVGDSTCWQQYSSDDGAFATGTYDPADGYDVVLFGCSLVPCIDGFHTTTTYVLVHSLTAPPPVPSSWEIDLGQTLTLTASASGGGNGGLTFDWNGLPPGCTPSSPGGSVVTCTPTRAGTYEVADTVSRSNGLGGITSVSVQLRVNPDPTVSIASTAASVDLGSGSVTFSATASGGTGPASYTYAWSGLPAGCATSSNVSSVLCTPSAAGTSPVTVHVVDALGFGVQSSSLTFTVYPPLLSGSVTLNRTSVDNGQGVGISTATPTGGSGGYAYLWNHLPTGCSSTSQVFSCTPSVSSAGCFPVNVSVTDSNGVTSTSAPVSLCVQLDPTLGPLGATRSALDVGQSTLLSSALSGGSGGDLYAWTGLPAGCLPVNAPSVSCTPSAAGTYAVQLTVTDSNGYVVRSSALTLTVSPDPSVGTPTATNVSLDDGQSTTLSVSSTMGAGGLTFSWSGLPLGCTALSVSSFRCVPATGTQGTYWVNVTVTDANGYTVSSGALRLEVDLPPAISSLTASTSSLDVGESVLLTALGTVGSGGAQFLWSGLPRGCSSANGWSVSCTPTAAGPYASVSLTVTDSNGGSASFLLPYTIDVSTAPWADAPSESPGTIDLGTATSLSVVVGFGAPWASLQWQGLPAGCASSNASAISCTPTATGTYAVSLTVQDSNGVSVKGPSATLVVLPALSVPTLSASATALDVGQGLTLSALLSGGDGVYHYLWSGLPRGCADTGNGILSCTPSGAGAYRVEVQATDGTGAMSAGAFVNLTVAPALGVTLSASPTNAVSGTTITFTTSVTGGTGTVSLLWFLNGTLVPNAHGTTFQLTGAGAGTYSVQVSATDQAGASVSSAPASVLVSPPVVKPAATPAPPFATPAEYLLMGLLVVLIVMGVLALLLLLPQRRRGSKATAESTPAPSEIPEPPKEPEAPAPAPAEAPPSE